jgi:hypothetical protein
MNKHKKTFFLMHVRSTHTENEAFLCVSNPKNVPQRRFATTFPHQSPRAVAQYRITICAMASHKFKSRNAAIRDGLATLNASLSAELDRVSLTLTRRIRELAERYATPLPALADEVEALSAKVCERLKKMGVVWN